MRSSTGGCGRCAAWRRFAGRSRRFPSSSTATRCRTAFSPRRAARTTTSPELGALRRLPTDVAAFKLLRPIFDHGGKARSRRQAPRRSGGPEARAGNARPPGPRPAPRGDAALRRARRVRRALRPLLEGYWDAAFEQEWARIEPLLADAIVQAGRRIAGGGLYGFLAGLAPALRVEPAEHRFGLDIPHDHTVTLSARSPLVLGPERLRLAARPRELRRAVATDAHLPRAAPGREPAAGDPGRAHPRGCERSPTPRACGSWSSSARGRARRRSSPRSSR